MESHGSHGSTLYMNDTMIRDLYDHIAHKYITIPQGSYKFLDMFLEGVVIRLKNHLRLTPKDPGMS